MKNKCDLSEPFSSCMCALHCMKLDAIEVMVAYPDRTYDDDYLEMLYGEV